MCGWKKCKIKTAIMARQWPTGSFGNSGTWEMLRHGFDAGSKTAVEPMLFGVKSRR